MVINGWFVLFGISLTINAALAWVLKTTMEDIADLRAVAFDLYEECFDFAQHLEVLYNMNSYHGDEVLHNLVKHSKALMNSFTEYGEITEYLEDPEEYDEENDYEEGGVVQ